MKHSSLGQQHGTVPREALHIELTCSKRGLAGCTDIDMVMQNGREWGDGRVVVLLQRAESEKDKPKSTKTWRGRRYGCWFVMMAGTHGLK